MTGWEVGVWLMAALAVISLGGAFFEAVDNARHAARISKELDRLRREK